jgi:hypothetical protein
VCGQLGEPCCQGGIGCTAPFATCSGAGLCTPCGGLGERCCPGQRGGDYCGAPYACGQNGRCALCGGAGQVCCPGATCTTGTCNLQNMCN